MVQSGFDPEIASQTCNPTTKLIKTPIGSEITPTVEFFVRAPKLSAEGLSLSLSAVALTDPTNPFMFKKSVVVGAKEETFSVQYDCGRLSLQKDTYFDTVRITVSETDLP